MAATYYQNKNDFELNVPTAGGSGVCVKPGKFVIDKTGTYYAPTLKQLGLTAVILSDVVTKDVAYTYNPAVPALLDNTTGMIDPSQDPNGSGAASAVSGYSGYCGTSGYSGYVGTSGYSGAVGTSGYSGVVPDPYVASVAGISGIVGVSGAGCTIAQSGYTLWISVP